MIGRQGSTRVGASRSGQDLLARRQCDGVRAVTGAEFAVQRTGLGLHGVFGKVQVHPDVTVGQSPAPAKQDSAFGAGDSLVGGCAPMSIARQRQQGMVAPGAARASRRRLHGTGP